MANLRKVPTAKLSTFEDLPRFLSLTTKFHEHGRSDYVFDMYSNDPSVKDSERKRRCDKVPVKCTEIKPTTPLPKDIATFWPCSTNFF